MKKIIIIIKMVNSNFFYRIFYSLGVILFFVLFSLDSSFFSGFYDFWDCLALLVASNRRKTYLYPIFSGFQVRSMMRGGGGGKGPKPSNFSKKPTETDFPSVAKVTDMPTTNSLVENATISQRIEKLKENAPRETLKERDKDLGKVEELFKNTKFPSPPVAPISFEEAKSLGSELSITDKTNFGIINHPFFSDHMTYSSVIKADGISTDTSFCQNATSSIRISEFYGEGNYTEGFTIPIASKDKGESNLKGEKKSMFLSPPFVCKTKYLQPAPIIESRIKSNPDSLKTHNKALETHKDERGHINTFLKEKGKFPPYVSTKLTENE